MTGERDGQAPEGTAADTARPATADAACGAACMGAGRCVCEPGPDGPGPDPAAGEAAEAVWAPAECTLPVAWQPDRTAEFDTLFTAALRRMARPSPTVLHLYLDAAAGTRARDLAARESGCCSFFTFGFTARSDGLRWEVSVPQAHVPVLDALAGRAAETMRDAAR
ncbi:hypothetical protein [Saccharomonospora iraqiensis]|uniref:hypothetical protein n=1 Tax=Saccharomonospora iraqiensis TaxID=52698 RepID=UPI001F416F14|nr:hypothetical protein [Saccharomonospora iraqiensis]